MNKLVPAVRRQSTVLAIVFDVFCWVVAYGVFAWLRLDQVTSRVPWAETLGLALATAVIYVLSGAVLRLHQGRSNTGSLEQMLLLGTVAASTGAAAFAANLISHWIPRSVPAGATLGALVAMAYGRAVWRRMVERDRPNADVDRQRVLVVGAGEAARELLSSMRHDPARRWHPVGLVDDDLRKRHLRLRGLPVLGTTHQLSAIADELGVGTVLIAIPSANSQTINRLRLAALEAGREVKVLPATTQLLTDRVGIQDLRDINLTDVLGRNQLDTDIDSIADYITGKRVLVTGAGGSIGSELCRQLHRFAPAELMMLDRDESALHAVQLSIHGQALLDSDEVILCDIRDARSVHQIFATRRPQVVFHAAALKHLPMLEQYPAEAVKTNVEGTHTLLRAADLIGVEHFVNISTDKAANPTSVLGWSKRMAERLTAAFGHDVASGTFVSVRFGNVLGSRGSVLTSFAKQIARGGPLTVTHPEVTRYFMTIEEACQLVIQAAAIGRPGEALVLDMGEPIKILDVAKQLMEQSGVPVKIEYTGLRQGEKLHEELFGSDEPENVRPTHPLVCHVDVPPLTAADLGELGELTDKTAVIEALSALAESPSASEMRPVMVPEPAQVDA